MSPHGRHESSHRPSPLRIGAFVALGVILISLGFMVMRNRAHDESRPPVRADSPPTTAPPASTAPPTPTPGDERKVPKPRIVDKPIPFPKQRVREMEEYAQRHYGLDSAELVDPKVIVEHFTGGDSFEGAFATFAANRPDLGELPGTCAHFVVDTDGTIYQLVPLGLMCRHTVGLNDTAVGIEMVGTSDEQILSNPKQLDAALGLTLWLMQEYGIQLRNVIGHNESLTSPYHHELVASWRCQTHSDWQRGDMRVFRRDLAKLAGRYSVPLGPAAEPVTPDC